MKPTRNPQAAFSLVEVTLAIGVAAFCLLAIFGLLPIGLNSNQSSVEQTIVSSIARGIVSDLRSTMRAAPATPVPTTNLYSIPIPTTNATTSTIFIKEDGSKANNATDDARYRADVMFAVPPAAMNYFSATGTATKGRATMVRIFITWPAAANPTTSVAPKNFAGSYEVLTALDRK